MPTPYNSADAASGISSGVLSALKSAPGFRSAEATQMNVSEWERLASLASGAALAAFGIGRGTWTGALLALAGGGLVYRGATGRCGLYRRLGISTAPHNAATVVPAHQGCKVETTLVIKRPAQELYRFWRDLRNLPGVLQHIEKIRPLDDTYSRWQTQDIFGKNIAWVAEIFNDRPHELIAWRSLPGGDVSTAGSIRFRPLEFGRETEVTVSFKYLPPHGTLVCAASNWLTGGLQDKIEQDLKAYQTLLEFEDEPIAFFPQDVV